MKPTQGTKPVSKISTIFVLIFVLLIGMALDRYILSNKTIIKPTSEIVRENSPKYKLINPLLFAGDPSDNADSEYKVLENEINSYISSAKKTSAVQDTSVYFRDLNTGTWTGVNENDKYAPGSMLKVAVLIAYLKEGETNSKILDEQYSYKPISDPGQYFPPEIMLSEGNQRAGDLIKNMIINSDNSATLLLIDKHRDAVTRVYQDLQMPLPNGTIDFMSAKNYSVLWRVLYNGTYLTKYSSEQALALLTLTKFKEGLVNGIPNNILIAHKFGEHTETAPGVSDIHELHDCGIIYPPTNHPYFVCIMTRGSSFDSLKKVISDLSKIIYTHVIEHPLFNTK